MYGLYLILVLVVTGGAIAFIGDRLGTKIGKKRLSLFGLRPRHTSNIITVITGFVITALTIGIMSATSENVRTALFGMEELNANLASKQHELENLSDELILATNEYQQANEDLKKSKDEIEELKNEQTELKEESDRLKQGNEELELKNAKLISDNENLSNTNENLTLNNAKLSSDNETLTKNNSELTANNEKLQSDNQNLETHNEQLRDGIVAIREGDIIFRAGEILASGIIKGNREASEIVKDIDNLADIATTNVSRKIGSTGEDSSVWIYQPELSEAVKAISASNQDVFLRIVAAGNLMRGEPVRSNLELFKNNKIYDKDEFIIAKAYEIKDGINSEQIIRNFLHDVNQAATAKGILTDPITGSVGVMEGSQLYQLVDAISKTKGLIVLTAFARDETTTMGPLRLNIKLEHSKEG